MWAGHLAAAEIAAFARARRRFRRRPDADRLHDLRVCARRLLSLDEDLGTLLRLRGMKRLRRFVHLTGEARDASVLRALLRDACEASERAAVRPLARDLRRRERRGMRRIRRAVTRLRVRAS